MNTISARTESHGTAAPQLLHRHTCRRGVVHGYELVQSGDARSTSERDGLAAVKAIGHHTTNLCRFPAGDGQVPAAPPGAIAFV